MHPRRHPPSSLSENIRELKFGGVCELKSVHDTMMSHLTVYLEATPTSTSPSSSFLNRSQAVSPTRHGIPEYSNLQHALKTHQPSVNIRARFRREPVLPGLPCQRSGHASEPQRLHGVAGPVALERWISVAASQVNARKELSPCRTVV